MARKRLLVVIALLVLGMSGCRPSARSSEPTAIGNAATGSLSATPEFVRVEPFADGFISPVGLIPSPDGTGRLFVVDQTGLVWALSRSGERDKEPFLALRSRMVRLNSGYDERGLLGLAFHPSFKGNGRLFVYYSAPLRDGGPAGFNHTSHLSEFRVKPGNAEQADPASERVIMQIDQPQANHNGGPIAFGPNGYLYIPLGDGGGANDVGLGHSPSGNGQDIETLLGKILRIDVDRGQPYGIPPDNPFVGKEGRDEIYAYGFRNPFMMSFDKGGNRELFVGDVGQNLFEEVDTVAKGGNYGWRLMEGAHGFDPQNPRQAPATFPRVDARGQALTLPIIEYGRGEAGGGGTAVIGGFVYRGAAIPKLQGAYVYGDFAFGPADGRLFVAVRPSNASQIWPTRELGVGSAGGRLNAYLKSLGQDASGELYALVTDSAGPSGSGRVLKIVP